MIEKSNYDQFVMEWIEKILQYLRETHQVTNIDELEKKLLEDAKRDVSNRSFQEQIAFVGLVKEIMDAYKFASEKHSSQKRDSGEPYIEHPLFVALNELYHQKSEVGKFAEAPIITALLHDTIEDTTATYSDINQQFGKRVENLVNNLTNKPEWSEWKEKGTLTHLEKSAMQFINADKDPDSLSVKFDDRFHNLETLRFVEPKRQVNKILDTLSVGFIEKAEQLQQFTFLVQLYIAMKRYLTNHNLELFADDADYAKRKRDLAFIMIKSILDRNKELVMQKMGYQKPQ